MKNGLGSNTCVQDAFNLAWKLAYVLKGWLALLYHANVKSGSLISSTGKAAPSLLNTFELERKPVGAGIVTRSTTGMKGGSTTLMELFGCYEESAEARNEKIAALSNPENACARRELRKSLEHTVYE